ncbi:acyl-coenzyme A thioesterase 9, mitochondrial-like isoform X2 [Papaver somniferum]|uniref:acyl-coenzyme A thioesterase 9, mitochondrial-like isoform X2 n=1 Tax=Papaver somniferum TaxID=3469 RepID=UPI000E6F4A64|nr:acyl-coenzyme A thioesterase 9, mitochondrial-like isoform X2 [Papaver somniferum]
MKSSTRKFQHFTKTPISTKLLDYVTKPTQNKKFSTPINEPHLVSSTNTNIFNFSSVPAKITTSKKLTKPFSNTRQISSQKLNFSSVPENPSRKMNSSTEEQVIPVVSTLSSPFEVDAGSLSRKPISLWPDSTTRPLLLVTASVDKMVLRKPLRVDADLRIAGAVTWVGRSSIEIQLEVTQPSQDSSRASEDVALTANFTFVARDSKTNKSAPVNRVLPESEQEKMLWEEAEARDKTRKRKRGEKKIDIENGEDKRLKALLAEGRIFCDMPALANRDSILLKDTCLEYSLICQPQQRNIHGRIFGGFLMHRAFELAYSTAYAFAGLVPCFLEVDHVDFLRPVDVGDFLRFKSCVLYTELDNPLQPLINIEVVAHVTRPELRTSEVSNTFHFTFSVRNPETLKNGSSIRSVVPATEEEARRILERMDADKS